MPPRPISPPACRAKIEKPSQDWYSKPCRSVGSSVSDRPPGSAAASGYRPFTIMGKTYDPAKPQAYLDSFAIKRA